MSGLGDRKSNENDDPTARRVIAHLDLDAFFVSVELLKRPDLQGLPVIVAGSGPRSVVTTASYAARRFGVGSAMPAAKALRLCPTAIVIPPDGASYREMSGRVMDVVRSHVDLVEQAGLDEAYVDLTGMTAPAAAMRRICVDIKTTTQLDASIGIGPNRLVAKMASDLEKPRGFVQLTREQACHRFAQQSCSLIPGIGPKTQHRLHRLGVNLVEQLANAAEEDLVAEFGPRHGPWLIQRARFIDETPVEPVREAVSESRETTFDVDLTDPAEIERRLDLLSGELCSALQTHGHRGRTIGIKVRYDDFDTHTRARTVPEPINDAPTVASIARQLLRSFAPNRPVRLLGVRVAGFAESHAQEGQLALPLT
jgi:DNA polymerase-4